MEKKVQDLFVQKERFCCDLKNDLNILLLGDTGVGKSTFINSIANYLVYQDFNEVIKTSLLCVIPSIFRVIDDEGKTCKIVVGSANEEQMIKPKLTQEMKSYIFPIRDTNMRIRFIDTPGMLDSKYTEENNLQCESILSYINKFHQLHAICLVFKSNDFRITQTFKYYYKQILSKLDKTATKNIIFIFTNSKSTNFQPGDAFNFLKKIIDDINSVQQNKIEVDKNVFCLDNEVFQYLAAIKQNLKFSSRSRHDFSQNWNKSSEVCWKLIKYLLGDSCTSPLEPHILKNSRSINETRCLIKKLDQPLMDIMQWISENLHILECHENELKRKNYNLDELKCQFHIPILNMRPIKVPKPVIICKNFKCAEELKVNGMSIWNYKKLCPNSQFQLKDFLAVSKQKCTDCKCPRLFHCRAYYLIEKFFIHDKSIEFNIKNQKQEHKRILEEIKYVKREFEKEQNIIMDCTVNFSNFLKKTETNQFNDPYRTHLEILNDIKTKDKGTANLLQNLLNSYNKYHRMTEKFSNSGALSIDMLTENMYVHFDELFELKRSGIHFRELFKIQETLRKNEFETTECVLNISIKLEHNMNGIKNHDEVDDRKKMLEENSVEEKLSNQKSETSKSQSQKMNLSNDEIKTQRREVKKKTEKTVLIPKKEQNHQKKDHKVEAKHDPLKSNSNDVKDNKRSPFSINSRQCLHNHCRIYEKSPGNYSSNCIIPHFQNKFPVGYQSRRCPYDNLQQYHKQRCHNNRSPSGNKNRSLSGNRHRLADRTLLDNYSSSETSSCDEDDIERNDEYEKIKNNIILSGLPEINQDDCEIIMSKLGELFDIDFDDLDFDTTIISTGESGKFSLKIEFSEESTKEYIMLKKKKIILTIISVLPSAKKDGIVYINDELTTYHQLLLKKARDAKKKLDFKYAWYANGKIYMRKSDSSKVVEIKSKRNIEELIKSSRIHQGSRI